MVKILILEDDRKMAAELETYLDNKGYDCELVYDGKEFLKRNYLDYQLYLLDINVPSVNGIEVCRKIRENNKKTPILMLTAYGSVKNKVEALDFGADDYLVKPFHLEELLARIKALLRRTEYQEPAFRAIIEIEDLMIDTTEMKVLRAGREIALTPKEYKLLELLAEAKGRTLSKQLIAEKVWDVNFETGTNTIEVYINFLRSKIDKNFTTKLIHTRPGYGYYLKKISK